MPQHARLTAVFSQTLVMAQPVGPAVGAVEEAPEACNATTHVQTGSSPVLITILVRRPLHLRQVLLRVIRSQERIAAIMFVVVPPKRVQTPVHFQVREVFVSQQIQVDVQVRMTVQTLLFNNSVEERPVVSGSCV